MSERVYITSYTKADQTPSAPSAPLPYGTIGEAQVALFPNVAPFQVRDRWQLFELGEGVRVALSTLRFA